MLVNKDQNFLFVHIQKTAGTSITHELLDVVGTEHLYYPHSLLKHVPLTPSYRDMFVFGFVRNPWDRLVSWYNMSLKKGPINSFHKYTLDNSNNFSEFMRCLEVVEEEMDGYISNSIYYKSLKFNQIEYLSDANDQVLAKFIGRFESLQDDMNLLSQLLQIPFKPLKMINNNLHNDYRMYYKDKDIEWVAKTYEKDINYFNYSF
jgi:chondroitin 4-sulfotransferase 11